MEAKERTESFTIKDSFVRKRRFIKPLEVYCKLLPPGSGFETPYVESRFPYVISRIDVGRQASPPQKLEDPFKLMALLGTFKRTSKNCFWLLAGLMEKGLQVAASKNSELLEISLNLSSDLAE